MSLKLHSLFFDAAEKNGSATALIEVSGARISYDELREVAEKKAALLLQNGIGKGSRVAVMAPKSISVVATILAVLKTGAAYIPIDPEIPRERLQHILADLEPHAFIAYPENFPSDIPCQQQMMSVKDAQGLSVTFLTADPHTEDLACILYTSGSTGRPKGVCITHENARGFTDWAINYFSPTDKNVFSSIAPLHFDLSVFDLYVGLSCGAAVVLFDQSIVQNARLLSEKISAFGISILYATPSLLSLLLNYGKIERSDFSALRSVLFAGEVFPVKHLHKLMEQWKNAAFYNLYGPTETNVCTYYAIQRPVENKRTFSYPIGKICEQLEGKLSNDGELLIAGPNVMNGYWKRSELNAKVFAEYEGKKFYKTGDRVELDADRNLVYSGRMDRLIKKRGYRIEPEEIEGILLHHPDVMEAAVAGIKDEEEFIFLKAFIALRPGTATTVQSLKKYCLEHLPAYMVPEQFQFMDQLPKTTSGKTDLNKLM